MAYFVIACTDKPASLALRMATREAHLAFIAAHRDAVRLAGPFLDEAGDMAGSMFIVEAESLAAATALNAADPYTQAGLFAQVDIRPWRAAVGEVP